MSRILVEMENVKESQNDVYVGWDNPLQTFFLQVYDMVQIDEDLQLIDWQGTKFGEIPTLSDLEKRAARYCSISEKMRGELAANYSERIEPTFLQDIMRKAVEGG